MRGRQAIAALAIVLTLPRAGLGDSLSDAFHKIAPSGDGLSKAFEKVRPSTTGYPAMGRAIDALMPAPDYSDVLAQRERSIEIMRARAHGFVPSPALRDYVKGILLRVVGGVKMPASFQPDVQILASPDFGAVCTPDGTIIVSMGLLERVSNEDELAFILAHEISHAIYRHHSSDWFTSVQYYAVVNTAALDEAGGDAGKVASAVFLAPVRLGAMLMNRLYDLSANVLAPQFQQTQEDQADALGFDMLVKAGYNPDGSQLALEHLAQSEAAAAKAAAEAKKAAEDAKSVQFPKSYGEARTLFIDNLDYVVAAFTVIGIAIVAAGVAIDKISEDSKAHRPATDRADALAAYQFREYRNVKLGNIQSLPWSAPANSSLAMLIANYRATDTVSDYLQAQRAKADAAIVNAQPAANTQVASADPKAAVAPAPVKPDAPPGNVVAAIDQIGRPPTADHAYEQFTIWRYRSLFGDTAAADIALDRAVQSPEPSWIAYDVRIQRDIDRKDFAAADKVMMDAVTRFKDSPILLPKRIAILHGLQRDDEISTLMDKCRAFDVKELLAECEKASGKTAS